ncbi:early nodulin-like protein 6 [Actinidia eriantha]|uniref:early nodulin-like protein 6 n=1 Tax=Actinidia eriantha TaxID=165200 RepID=UPI002588C399|nr:early nodulin-like protein 6 [Actinidia eriantha]
MCAEFEVGGDKGWGTPPSKNDQIYNQWASKNRFNVGDILRFKYNKDSVLVVTDEEYDKCKSSHPIFSNNGDTDFKLDRPGLFYFISGVAGHCERGLKMIIKVLELESPPAQPSSDQTNGGAVQVAKSMSSPPVVKLLVSFFGALFM